MNSKLVSCKHCPPPSLLSWGSWHSCSGWGVDTAPIVSCCEGKTHVSRPVLSIPNHLGGGGWWVICTSMALPA